MLKSILFYLLAPVVLVGGYYFMVGVLHIAAFVVKLCCIGG